MTQKLELYRCEICGNLVQVIIPGEGELVCCGQPMQLVKGKVEEESLTEKHVPVFIKNEQGQDIIQVGTVLHPMTDDHHIMFIETISEDKNHMHLQYLYPGMEAKALLENKLGKEMAYAFCNLHGLWEGESD